MPENKKQENYPGHHDDLRAVLEVLDESWEDFTPIGMTPKLRDQMKKELEDQLK